jgi:hypothetical protein
VRQSVEIIIPTSVDTDDPVSVLEGELRERIKAACDDLLGIDSCDPEAIMFEYGEPI